MTEGKKNVSISDNTTLNISMKMLTLILGFFITTMTTVYTINQRQHEIMEQRLTLLEMRMDRIESKLDLLLSMTGVDPNSKEIKDYIYAQQHKDEAINKLSNDIAKMISENIHSFKIMLSRPE